MYKFPRVLQVDWYDTCSGGGWRDRAAWQDWVERDGALQRSVGFFFSRDELSLTLVQSIQHSPNPPMDAMLQIPVGCIRRVRRLT